MSIGDNRLFLYDNNIDLVVTTNGLYTDNRPMNNRKLVAHKGLFNEFLFTVRNRDRKPQNIFSDELSAYLINPSTKRRIFWKLMEHTGVIGQVKLVLNDHDLSNVSSGLYTMYITRKHQTGENAPVYADQNNELVFNIQISDQLDETPVPTQETSTFVKVASTPSDVANVYATSALYGNQDRNFGDMLHSIAVYPSSYSGNIKIQASCIESVPDNDDTSSDWFTVVSDVELSSSSSILHRTFNVNANWVRVLHTPSSSNTGSITKVLLRN